MTSITISPLYHRNRAYGVPSHLNCKRTPEHPRGNRLRVITTLLNNVNIGRNEALSRVCGSTWWHCFEAFSSIWSEGIITLRRTPLESSEQSDSERFGSDYAFLEDALAARYAAAASVGFYIYTYSSGRCFYPKRITREAESNPSGSCGRAAECRSASELDTELHSEGLIQF